MDPTLHPRLGHARAALAVNADWLASLQRDLERLTLEEIAAELDHVIAGMRAADRATGPAVMECA